jgi:hypothetical protein
LRLSFDRRVKLKFLGSQITTDAGLLAYRELDEALRLTEMGADVLTDSRLGTNKQHLLVPMLRQSIFNPICKNISSMSPYHDGSLPVYQVLESGQPIEPTSRGIRKGHQ